MFTIVLTLIGALGYGWLSRMCGGGKPDLPFGLDAILYASLYGVVGFLLVGLWGAVFSFLFAFLGKRMGHGRFIDLGTWKKPAEREKLEYLMKPIWAVEDKSPAFYDFIGLSLSGLVCGLGLGGALILSGTSVLLGAGVMLGAALKGVSYAIGWGLPIKHPTELGEFLTGFFAGVPLILCFFLV